MAQRTIHYMIGEELIRRSGGAVRDVDRFRIGNLLPDAIEGLKDRALTHYQEDIRRDGKLLRISDFERFRREFAPLVERDGLYLGYYMHLVEDACYRRLWAQIGLKGIPVTEAFVERLHLDYHLLNAYTVRRWGLRDELVWPEGFEDEPINRIYPFLLRDFLAEMRGDFSENPQGETRYITERHVELYVSEYLGLCCEALRRVLDGNPLDPAELAWER
jgi:hypothetical protein